MKRVRMLTLKLHPDKTIGYSKEQRDERDKDFIKMYDILSKMGMSGRLTKRRRTKRKNSKRKNSNKRTKRISNKCKV
jgi:hypothetical protein